jgi:hypothetical protein
VTSTPSKTIILWGPRDLLGHVVENYLELRPEWNVVRLIESPCLEALVEQVECLQPAVVILCRPEGAGEGSLPLRLLRASPGLAVMVVAPDTNAIEVFHKQEVWLSQAADLLSVVERWPGQWPPAPARKEAAPSATQADGPAVTASAEAGAALLKHAG